MNGAQDLGGMMGFGPVVPEPETLRFHADWEKRALAVTLAAGAMGVWNIDTMRHTRESLPPAEYLSASYYEIWAKALANQLLADGLVSREELREGHAQEPPRPVPRVLQAADVAKTLAAGTQYERAAEAPAAFARGATVRTKVFHPTHHTRLPRYARGKRGVVEAVRGVFVFPDTNAHRQGEHPQWLYTVRFTGPELWGEGADPGLTVSIDAWESYLEAA
ncbi:nitrile hydratase subunit beta [Roseomonas sp. E05]|uniref:nitrile hydratase subunit beta n=1 Tax=Roseomonas sp. E05 TaxID=3046310 RepID=UPI0024BA3898|nr:nitrile hydratase subunit beta [Roseomonas sp. E05]MDJ0388384.1 nitrile hydratase subunit beta [Roseomonas sp. E05]